MRKPGGSLVAPVKAGRPNRMLAKAAAVAVAPAVHKQRRKRTDFQRNRETIRLQRASHSTKQLNKTQIKRVVVETLRRLAPGARISASAFAPIVHILEMQLHKVWTGARYISCVAAGRKSVDIKAFNLSIAMQLQPELFAACPNLRLSSFVSDTDGIQAEPLAGYFASKPFAPVQIGKAPAAAPPKKKEEESKKDGGGDEDNEDDDEKKSDDGSTSSSSDGGSDGEEEDK